MLIVAGYICVFKVNTYKEGSILIVKGVFFDKTLKKAAVLSLRVIIRLEITEVHNISNNNN